jgi:hypothetical protein
MLTIRDFWRQGGMWGRRLRRLRGLRPPEPSLEKIEQRRKQNRDRVRRYRERQRFGVKPEETINRSNPELLAELDAAEAAIEWSMKNRG